MYQRRKGRDLFDLYAALTKVNTDTDEIIRCYNRYIGFSVAQPPTKKLFLLNIEEKMTDNEFLGDTAMLLRPELDFNADAAYDLVQRELLEKLK